MPYKTHDEMQADSEFLQYQEDLISGSLADGTGTNRVLERLSANADALLSALRLLQAPAKLTCAGTVGYSTGSALSWTTDLVLSLWTEDLGRTRSVSMSASPVTLAAGSVMWVDIASESSAPTATVTPVVGTLAAFLTASAAAGASRMDLLPLAHADAYGVTLFGGLRIRKGFSTTNLVTDSQYTQQSETALRVQQATEDRNLQLIGGGDLSWDAAAETLSWTADLVLSFPHSAGYNRIVGPGSVVIPAGSAWYGSLSRTPGGVSTITTAVASTSGGVPSAPESVVLATHLGSDNRLYLRDGTAMSDGETLLLGGVRIGVQWHYKAAGLGVQALDFEANVGASAVYRVGTGELMVYRNGLKSIASDAVWLGTYPSGSLSGTIAATDDYVEEDAGGGLGYRILWLKDGGTSVVQHASGTHDPAQTWPSSADVVEVFIGLQGRAPTITVPDGIYGMELVRTTTPDTILVGQGTLVTQGDEYPMQGSIEVSTSDWLLGDAAPSTAAWCYLYAGPGARPGLEPAFVLSTIAPVDGVCPADATLRFVTSVYWTSAGQFHGFSRAGSYVHLLRRIDVSSSVTSIAAGSWATASFAATLPAGIRHLQLDLGLTALASVAAGSSLSFAYNSTGFSAPGHVLYGLKPSNTNMVYLRAEPVLDDSQTCRVYLDSASWQNIGEAYVTGYYEARTAAGGGL